MNWALTAFTARGAALAARLAAGLCAQGDLCALALPARLAEALGQPGYAQLSAWTAETFAACDGLIFVGACGIAVRAIAPHVRDKRTDPAVVTVDEAGQYAVSLLSGHVGGGNRLAQRVAALCGGTAVISTATDVNGLFAVDTWAAQQGLFLENRTAAKHLSAALLAGERVGFCSDLPVAGALPQGITAASDGALGFAVTLNPAAAPFAETLRLVPRILDVGIGCRRGVGEERIAAAVDAALRGAGLSPRALRAVHSIDLKRDERGLLDFCRTRGLPLLVHTAQALGAVSGAFTASDFVKNVTGVENVCERAAVIGGGALCVKKQAGQGVTVAIAAAPFTVRFEENAQ